MKTCKKCKGKGFIKGTNFGYSPCDCIELVFPLSFQRVHEANVERSTKDVKHSTDWSPMEWGCALAGEVGELCNYLKKQSRGDKIPKQELEHEIADIIMYVSLLSHNLNIDMEKALKTKFNIVSKRWGSKIKL